MSRGLDHVVHAVHDLDAAAELYRRLGFQVGARNRHPRAWGTQNHIVQLAGTFIELLAIADASGIVSHGPRSFSFGAFNLDYLARRQGLAMLVLRGSGTTDAEEFRAAGIGDFDLYEFEREATSPDGSAVKVAFALAFARDGRAPDVGFFTCLHRFPEQFWNPAFQVHANTASAVAGVVLVAENPSDHHNFLAAFTGHREMLATSSGITFKTPRGEVAVMTPASFREQFGTEPPDVGRGARLAALRFTVRDFGALKGLLSGAQSPFAENMGGIVIGSDSTMGATLAFER